VNLRAWPVLILLPLTLVAAKGEGCGAEYQGGDGGTAAWPLGNVPTAKGADLPMTCEWLESQNCWKEMIAEAAECAPKDIGTLDANRSGCEFDGQASLEFAGPLSTPAEGSTIFEFTDHRLFDKNGSPCFTAKILGIGRGAHVTRSYTVVSEGKSLLTYRIICPDGTSYANDVPGTCADFGSRYLQKKVPTYNLICQGSGCRATAGGATASGETTLAQCK
jgi:hypothetical protein